MPSQHYEPLIVEPGRLLAVESVMATLVDAADAFDAEGLQIDPACEIHGPRPVAGGSCTCRGERFTALEFIQTLMIDVRIAKTSSERHGRPVGTPDTSPHARQRRSLGQQKRWDRTHAEATPA